MAEAIARPRYGCALHGAVRTLTAIRGVVPIVHSNAGCAIQDALASRAGGFGNAQIAGCAIPGSAVQERHVIFGGASRLREQIKNSLKVFNGELYVVLNSCESAMVGDDIEAMTREAQEQGEPVIHSLLAGFHGDSHYGYETVMADLFSKLPDIQEILPKPAFSGDKRKPLVNILGILPQQDLYFRGELLELRRILTGAGIQANTFFLSPEGVKELAAASKADLTLVFSRWGVKAARKLEELYQIPYQTYDTVPTGMEEVETFVRQVAGVLSLPEETIHPFLKRERESFEACFACIREAFYAEHANHRFALVGEERQVKQYAGFLSNYFQARITAAVITDVPRNADTYEGLPLSAVSANSTESTGLLSKNTVYTSDAQEIARVLRSSSADIVLGSSLEADAAIQSQAVLLPSFWPVYRQAIYGKSWSGITGAITFAEDYMTKGKELLRLRGKSDFFI